jgi:hypothetical protein
MFNNELVEKLIEHFDVEKVTSYCLIEAVKNQLLYNECIHKNEHVECIEYDYERDWWAAKHSELLNTTKKTRYEWTRTIG